MGMLAVLLFQLPTFNPANLKGGSPPKHLSWVPTKMLSSPSRDKVPIPPGLAVQYSRGIPGLRED